MCINESRRRFIKTSTLIMGGGLLSLSLADDARGLSPKPGECAPNWELLGKRSRSCCRIRTKNGEYLVNYTGLKLLESMRSKNTGMLNCLAELSRRHPDIPLETLLHDCEHFDSAAKAAAIL